ncbi:hypothetical protein KKC59_01175 [bacterium]|nr:hypothetical protein [bacterium]
MNLKFKFCTILCVCMFFTMSSYVKAETKDDSTAKNILRDGLFGAGVGAISASASGGKAGKGALVGAGANVVGNLLFDSIGSGGSSQTQAQPQPQPVQYQQVPVYQQPVYYDDAYAQRRPVRAPETERSPAQRAYEQGYEEGYRIGYKDGLKDAKSGY